MRGLVNRARLLFAQPPAGPRDWRFLAAIVLGAVILALLPFGASAYWLLTIRDASILALLALSLDLLWGRGGVLVLGHGVFFGLGAYGMAAATMRFDLSPFAGLALGGALSGGLALTLGYLLIYAGVRLHFFAIASLAVLLIAAQIATSWSAMTGGDVGMLGVPPLLPWLSDGMTSYYVHLAVMLVVLLALWLACRGNAGRVMAAIAMNERRARTFGYHTDRHLLILLVLSALLAGLAGALYASATGVVAPDLFDVLLSTQIIIWIAIGGRGTLLGPVVAVYALTWLQLEVSSFSATLWPLLLGVVFLALVLFLPKGLGGIRLLRAGLR